MDFGMQFSISPELVHMWIETHSWRIGAEYYVYHPCHSARAAKAPVLVPRCTAEIVQAIGLSRPSPLDGTQHTSEGGGTLTSTTSAPLTAEGVRCNLAAYLPLSVQSPMPPHGSAGGAAGDVASPAPVS